MNTLSANYASIAIVLAALLAICIPYLRSPNGYFALGTVAAIAVYGRGIFGFLFWIVSLFVVARVIDMLATPTATYRVKRWTSACVTMLIALAIFIAGSMHLLDRVKVVAFGVEWILPTHDMWLLLRTISFLWEFGSGRLKKIDFRTYLIWIALPFTLLGPLIRPSEFFPQLSRSAGGEVRTIVIDRKWWSKLALALTQMAAGVGLNCISDFIDGLGPHWPKVFEIFGTGPWSFFLSTSGFFHLMECLALFWQIQLPISFNYPFGQRNISDFWARWNMTVTRLCTDYLFYNRWGLKKINVYFNLILLFTAIGMWHDLNWYWVIWGLLHGLGFCAYVWYRNHKASFAFGEGITTPRIREFGSRALTYVFVCLCWYVANKITFRLLAL